MYRIFLNNFNFESQLELNRFIKEIIKIGEKYLGYLSFKGKIYIPFGLSFYDCAIDTLSEIFKVNGKNQLTLFYEYFSKPQNFPIDEEHFDRILNGFIITSIHQNLQKIFQQNDPFTYKILRNIKLAIRNNNYFETQLFSDRYIHRTEVDYNGRYIEREELFEIVYNNGKIFNLNNIPEFINTIFDILEQNPEYIQMIALNDLVYIFRSLIIHDFNRSYSLSSNHERDIYFELTLEEVKKKFMSDMKKYFIKKNFSENDINCLYNMFEEYYLSAKNAKVRLPISFLIEKYPNSNGRNLRNQVEYLIELFNQKLIKRMEEEMRYEEFAK